MRAELTDSAGRVLAESRGIRTFADGGLEESVLGLVLLLVYGGVLTMTSRFELSRPGSDGGSDVPRVRCSWFFLVPHV